MDYNSEQNPLPQTAPHATASLVLGILSILSGCVVIGFVLGIIGLVLAIKGQRAYNSNPARYSGAGLLKAGKITSIVGIVLGSAWIVYLLLIVFAVAAGTGIYAFSELLNQ